MKKAFLLALLVTSIALAGCTPLQLGSKNLSLETQPSASPEPSPAPLDMTGWKQFDEKYYHLSFKLPPSLANQPHADNQVASVSPEKGNIVCFEIWPATYKFTKPKAEQGCNMYYWMSFVIGGNSVDYTNPGRGVGIADIRTFKTKNGQHYLSIRDDNETSIESVGEVKVTEFTNAQGFHILMLEDLAANREAGPIPGLNGPGVINALVQNPTNPTYPIFSVQMTKTDVLTTAVFRQILETLEPQK